jgi:hypothetical protein
MDLIGCFSYGSYITGAMARRSFQKDMSMSTLVSSDAARKAGATEGTANPRAQALADRLEQGAAALYAFASTLTDAEWQTRVPKDGRKIGVTVHHVANMYPLEMQLSQKLASGGAIEGVTWDVVAEINAAHAKEQDGVTKEEALEALRRNSAAAAAGIRAMSDEQLERAAPISLNSDAPLTCQFWLEDHPVRHSYHHLARIRATVKR